jgi:hypothetical protein
MRRRPPAAARWLARLDRLVARLPEADYVYLQAFALSAALLLSACALADLLPA